MRMPRRRWVGLALLASLAINLFFVGLLAGQGFRDHRTPPRSLPGLSVADWNPGGFARILRRLPDAYREPAQEVVARHREGLRDAAGRVADAREGVLAALQSGTDLEAALADLRSAGAAAQEDFHGLLVDLHEAIGPDLFEAVRAVRRDRPGGRDHH